MLDQNLVSKVETVSVGMDSWMVSNLNVSCFRNGDAIPEVTDPVEWSNCTTPAWCYYNNDPANGAIYGKLYNSQAINDPRGLAPDGFHLPTEEEWTAINQSLRCNGAADSKRADCNSTCANFTNRDLAQKCGFTILGGYRYSDGSFSYLESSGFWWCASDKKDVIAWVKNLGCSFSNSYKNAGIKAYGYAMRCIQD